VFNKKRQALDAVESAALAAWEALPPDEKRARLAGAQQARARIVSAVAAAMPEVLLQGSEGADVLQGSSSRQQFDDWRGIPGKELEQQQQQQHATAQDEEQQQQQEVEGSWTDAQWAEYYAANPEAYAQWQQHYGQQQQQQQQEQSQQGAWYEGWRQRHRPEASNGRAAAAAAAQQPVAVSSSKAAAAEPGESAGGLGLLAGYGSGSESDDDQDAEVQQDPSAEQQQQGVVADAERPESELGQQAD
jgi:hypothetical protein